MDLSNFSSLFFPWNTEHIDARDAASNTFYTPNNFFRILFDSQISIGVSLLLCYQMEVDIYFEESPPLDMFLTHITYELYHSCYF